MKMFRDLEYTCYSENGFENYTSDSAKFLMKDGEIVAFDSSDKSTINRRMIMTTIEDGKMNNLAINRTIKKYGAGEGETFTFNIGERAIDINLESAGTMTVGKAGCTTMIWDDDGEDKLDLDYVIQQTEGLIAVICMIPSEQDKSLCVGTFYVEDRGHWYKVEYRFKTIGNPTNFITIPYKYTMQTLTKNNSKLIEIEFDNRSHLKQYFGVPTKCKGEHDLLNIVMDRKPGVLYEYFTPAFVYWEEDEKTGEMLIKPNLYPYDPGTVLQHMIFSKEDGILKTRVKITR